MKADEEKAALFFKYLHRQLAADLSESEKERWKVSGAGSPMADGTYVLTTNERDGAPVYARDGGKWRLLRMQISGSAHWLVVDGATIRVYRNEENFTSGKHRPRIQMDVVTSKVKADAA